MKLLKTLKSAARKLLNYIKYEWSRPMTDHEYKTQMAICGVKVDKDGKRKHCCGVL